jgi:hypothetical protein
MSSSPILAGLLPPQFEEQLHHALLDVSGGLLLFLLAVSFLLCGWLVSLGLSRGIQALLALVGVDASVARLRAGEASRSEFLPSRVVGYLVFWSTFLAAWIVILRTMGVDFVPAISTRLLDVVPRVFIAALVLVAGIPAAVGSARFVHAVALPPAGRSGRLRLQALTLVLVAFVVLLALEQLGLAAQLVVAIGVAAVAAAGLALALAFGLGCRDLARDLIVEYLRASGSESGPDRV